MSELDDFRPRIRNWARVVRDHPAQGESNLMPYLRSIDKSDKAAVEPRTEPDYQDAWLIDESIRVLRTRSEEFDLLFLCLKAEYLIRWESPESEEEERKLIRKKARVAKAFWWRYAETLAKAEECLMRYVDRKSAQTTRYEEMRQKSEDFFASSSD